MTSRSRVLGKNAEYYIVEGEVASGETIYPGMLVETTGTVSTAGADTPTFQVVDTIEQVNSMPYFATVPDTPPHANDSDDPVQHEYDAGEHIEVARVYAGEVQGALLANGNDLSSSSEANVSYDNVIASNDDGAIKQSSSAADATFARAREAVDNQSGGGSDGPGDMKRIRIEVL